ncbi:PREDICTED: 2'-5'-oligoadenylate synthase 1-like [Calidris pugnax]|uniref:2'-5'-oligoadenylate synthase 1-like n=1 Tax=Calidris pugnax TaxID=198806 RepID=UPI00071C2E4C|nr:PREDICTED: 2'-5'-oligoadenylate synthase 1-like [Calidris pugnax]
MWTERVTTSGRMDAMNGLLKATPKTLDTWIMEFLQPSTDFRIQVKQTIRQICDFLKEDCFPRETNIHVNKTVKGGSSGKGTALKNTSDADVVLFLSCFSSYQDQKKNRKYILDLIKMRLHDCRQSLTFTVDISEPRYKGPGNTPRSLSLTLNSKINSESTEVDILPAYDALGQVRRDSWLDPNLYKNAYVELLKANGGPGEFSPCFTELQKKFVKRYPPKLKSLLRLVKYWYKERVKPRCGTSNLPPKYALELLTIYAWEQGTGSNESFDTAQGFRTVMELLCRHQEICIYWEGCYSLQHSEISAHVKSLLCKPRPIILDPADPTGILGQGDRWDLLAREAARDLSLSCVMSIKAWNVQPATPVTIEVKQLAGTRLRKIVSPSNTVRQLKEMIEQEWDIPWYRQRLSQQDPGRRNVILQDGETLATHGILYSTTLLLLQTDTMEVFVKDEKNRTTTYTVSPTNTVRQLKEQIQRANGPHPDQQRLMYSSVMLDDRHTLAHYGIQPMSTIFMTLPLRGGCKPLHPQFPACSPS